MQCKRFSFYILVRLEFSRQIFENKNTQISNHENFPSGSRVVPRGRIDKRTDMTKVISRFSQFCGRALKGHEQTIVLLIRCNSVHFTRIITYVLFLPAAKICH